MFGAREALFFSQRLKRAAEIEDLIRLGFRISLGSFIQDIWMGLSAFRVFFLPDNVDVTPQSEISL